MYILFTLDYVILERQVLRYIRVGVGYKYCMYTRFPGTKCTDLCWLTHLIYPEVYIEINLVVK